MNKYIRIFEKKILEIHKDFEEWVKFTTKENNLKSGILELASQYDVNYIERYEREAKIAIARNLDIEEDEVTDEQIEEQSLKLFEEDLGDEFYNWLWIYDNYEFPMNVYRCIALPVKSMVELKLNPNLIRQFAKRGIGIFWANVEASAVCHWTEGGTDFIFRATIEEEQVNWDETLDVNMSPNCGKEEQEIRLNDNIRIKLTGVKTYHDDKFLSMNYRVKV